jgi:poly(3-hydroxybutyrate) depolymerase
MALGISLVLACSSGPRGATPGGVDGADPGEAGAGGQGPTSLDAAPDVRIEARDTAADLAADLAVTVDVAPMAVNRSEACGQSLPAPQEGIHTLAVGALQRKFFLRMPAAYDGTQPWPVVFAFHGAGNKSASWFDTNTDLKAQLEEKAVLVFPEGPAKPDGTLSWVYLSPQNVLFVDAMIDWLKKNACIDPARLFATGQSSGGYMAMTLGCQRGDVFRSVATSSGGIFDPTTMAAPGPCVGTPGVFLRTGKADTASTHDSVVKTRDFWSAQKGCADDPPQATDPAPCVRYAGCRGAVIWCEDGGSHDWPSYATRGMWGLFSTP